jgi:hypothetical protein
MRNWDWDGIMFKIVCFMACWALLAIAVILTAVAINVIVKGLT